ncbi:MAG: restriction endonuclease [Acidobacteriia bacterium]|nr:restriction endonuclease [Terriglobia bacterium]
MAIPGFESLMLPVLRLTADGKEHALVEIRGQIARELRLSDAELAEHYADSLQVIFPHRIRWALQYLKESGILESVKRGVYKITDRGLSLLKQDPSRITVRMLQQFPEFRDFKEVGSAPAVQEILKGPLEDANGTPDEQLDSSFRQIQEALASDLLDKIQKVTDKAFEQLAVHLVERMSKGTGEVVGKPGDAGIDGVIVRDQLGLDRIYVQAKQWSEPVGRSEIQKFSGALMGQNADRGVFVTSSKFSRDAREYVATLPKQKIALIDGKQLAVFMIQNDLGVTDVSPPKTYRLKQLDETYFENLEPGNPRQTNRG